MRCQGRGDSMENGNPYTAVRRWRLRAMEGVAALIVLVSRVMTLPKTPWELDEILFMRAVIDFEPVHSRPHPPGYPLLVGMGKVAHWFVADPWFSLVIVSVISSVIGFLALSRAASALTGEREAGCIAALIFYFSASMLVHGSLALSDAPMLMFIALALERATKFPAAGSDRRAAAIGTWLSAAIGTRPQMAIALLPMFLVILWQMGHWRHRAMAVFFFAFISILWFAPLVDASGGWSPFVESQRNQAAYVASHDAGQSRGAGSIATVAVRFLLHPWGPKAIAFPLMIVAAGGAVAILRRRNWKEFLPLATMTVVHIGFAIVAMDPADGARYSLPSMLIVAVAAAVGLRVMRNALVFRPFAWVAVALFAVGSLLYVSPVLQARTRTPSPPVQAATYASRSLSPDTVILYDLSLRPHADQLFAKFRSRSTEAGLNEFYARPDIALVYLTDGGSSVAGSKSFEWPPSDAYGKITRNHYRVVSLEPVPPASRFLPIEGVSAPERTMEGLTWRWLGPQAFLRLPPRQASTVTLRLALSLDTPYRSNHVRVLVDGVPAAESDVTAGEATTLIVPLGQRGPGVLTIRSEQSFVPAAVLGNRDARRVSVKLLALEQR